MTFGTPSGAPLGAPTPRDRLVRRFAVSLRRNWMLYAMVLIPAVYLFVFKYLPLSGLRLAFQGKPLKISLPYSGAFAGFQVFEEIFKNREFWLALRNTLMLNLLDLLVGFPFPILLALLLNEVRHPRFKRVSQTVLYLPHFLSWVIIAGIMYQLLAPHSGLVNVLIKHLGGQPARFLTTNVNWVISYTLIGVWQNMGWGSIIYLSAISSISPELYEAATMDGAGRLRKILSVTLPCIRATIVIMLIMQLGRMMNSGLERARSLGNVMVRDMYYVLSIFVQEKGLASLPPKYNIATAAGMFQGVVGLLLVLLADTFSKRIGEDGLL